MASYYFRNTGDTNWGTASNWSLTDGGGATGSVPTSSDDAFFSNNSGNCVVNTSTRVCLTLDFTKGTGFTGSFTTTLALTVSGNVTLNGAMTWAGSAVLTVNTSATITSNGITITSSVTFSGVSTTITLADDMRISGATFLPSANVTMVYSGAFTIYFSGTSFTSNQAFTSANTKIEFTGNITIGSSQGIGFNEIRINTGSNTFTSGSMNVGSTTNTTTITYVSGTVSMPTGTFLACIGSVIFNTYPIKWNFLDFNNGDNNTRTITINSPLLAKELKILGSGTSTPTTLAGSYGFECDILHIIFTTSSRTLTLSAGATYKVNNFFVTGGNLSSPSGVVILNTSSSGQKATILIGKYCNTALQNITITDIDNGGPNRIPIFQNTSTQSSLTRSAGWVIVPNGQAYIPSTSAIGGLDGGVNTGLF